MSTPHEQPSSPRVRDLTRWRIPFHYAPSIAVAAIGIGMLLIGGVVGGFGGWVLAVALPIAIGAFLRSAWFALVPVAVWAGWLIHVAGAAPDADLSNTPFELALLLATIGAGATLLAQRAVFPATEPIAWKAPTGRLVPPLDDGETPPLADDVDEDALDAEVSAGLQVTDDELAEAQRAAETENATKAPVEGDETDDEPSDDESDAATVEADDQTSAVAADDAAEADDADDAEAVDAEAVADEPDDGAGSQPTVDLVKAPVANELPLDADPAPLDEGGHVTEFSAISEADLEAEASDDDDDDDDARTPAHADSEAAQR